MLPVIEDRVIHATETCMHCTRAVVIDTLIRGAALPATTDGRGYDGLTDDGAPVCPDHWCAECRGAHIDAEEFELCEDGYDPIAERALQVWMLRQARP